MEEQRSGVVEALRTNLEVHDDNRKAVQEKLHGLCEKLREQIDEMEDRINRELESEFKTEDDRLQGALYGINSCDTTNEEEAMSFIQKARAELLVRKSYYFEEAKAVDIKNLSQLYKLKIRKEIVMEQFGLKRPIELKIIKIEVRKVHLRFSYLNNDEERILNENGFPNFVTYAATFMKKGCRNSLRKCVLEKECDDTFTFPIDGLELLSTYVVCVKAIFQGGESQPSNEVEFVLPWNTEYCIWKKCPDNICVEKNYAIDEDNPRIATKVHENDYCYGYEYGREFSYGYSQVCCAVKGKHALPTKTIISWNIKILKSKNNDGNGIFIGVAPFDLNNNVNNYNKCGWYFDCYKSTLWSGPPHNYYDKTYGPRKEKNGQYVRTGDSVGVVMDTKKGELSFVVDGANLGVAYGKIPLDKPLVPCVLLYHRGDSVELDPSKAKESVDSSILVPSNILIKNVMWDSITFTWNKVVDASYYQVEVDGSISWIAFTKNIFTKKRLLPETEHSFRVRTVRGSSVGEWSSAVKGKTLKRSYEGAWKKCPNVVYNDRKYTVNNENPRIATKTSSNNKYYSYCSIIGNTPIPLDIMALWSVKVLRSKNNDGGGIYIGIAPFNIDQNNNNFRKRGWYFDCCDSKLWSGPPHGYNNKAYGPRKEQKGQYVRTGDVVGVVMDTTKGDLSFVLNGVNHGVAYCGIPLNKPLVPCVLLWNKGDSVELII